MSALTRRSFARFFAGGLFGVSAARSQEVYVSLIETQFTVTDGNGHLVKDLKPNDITVYDNDVPQEVSDLSQDLDAPLNIALVVDRSKSVADSFDFISEAASLFADVMVTPGFDQGLLVAFDSKVYLLRDWTSNPKELAASVSELSAQGGSSVFDAVYKTCRDKFDVAENRRRVLVLLTDGEDSTSRSSFDDALNMAKLWGVTVYVVGVRADGSLNTRDLRGGRVLRDLSGLTGGRAFSPEGRRPEQLRASFDELQAELRNPYTVSYYLKAPPDNAFHRIRIRTRDGSLRVHAPKGFYARKP